MTPLFIILYIVYLASSVTHSSLGTKTKAPHCDGHQANFSKSAVMGTWYVVALIPGIGLPRLRHVECYKMDLSETDEAGVRWLVKRKIKNPSDDFIRKLTGTIIRQRFHSEKPFDIWSKGYYTSRGCFRQLLSLETNNTNVADGEYYENYMQLHIVHTDDVRAGPYLVQVLWGRLISAIIYRRATGTSLERLEPIHEFVSKMRGHQQPPRICDLPLKVIPPPPFQRP
ncbi:uncharacterized protein LOC123876751 [Maniola jurtina]|uniref:uncharacterized protein LOC123876751 n=1 Tax=Maniola jurtina TaxID=191418 RepID=UPI001E68A82F|nr:uncharacterized protein LOC123876751 [Maniola jurtina]